MKPYFVVEAYTNVGRIRRNNEDNYYVNGKHLENAELDDYFIIDVPQQKGVFGVFDGMGGQSKGEFASYTAAKTLIGYQHDLLKNPDGFINDYVQNANTRICNEIQRTQSRIGTTMGVAVINDDKLKIYNIGDTRVYYFRDGKIYQLSKDHTTVSQLVEAGLMTREQAAVDKRKNELSQHLGIMPSEMVIQPFMSQEIEWGENDVLLICSDGVTDALTDDELLDIVNQCSHKGFFAEHIVKSAIRKGSKDNATAVVVQACGKNGIKDKKISGKKIENWVLALILVLCLMVGGLTGLLFSKLFNRNDVEEPTTTTSAQEERTTSPISDDPTGNIVILPPPDESVSQQPTVIDPPIDDSTTQPQPGNENVSVPASLWTIPKTGTIKPQESGFVNLRRLPGEGAEDITLVLREAKDVNVYAVERGTYYWYYVELDNNYYWVRADYIEINN